MSVFMVENKRLFFLLFLEILGLVDRFEVFVIFEMIKVGEFLVVF